MSEFLDAVTGAFRKLIERGLLTVVLDQYDANAFGNAVVILSGGNVFVRLVRDRGDISVDAASAAAQDDWAPLERVLAAIGVRGAPAEGVLTPTDAANLVEQHFTALDAGLDAKRLYETRTRLAEIRRSRRLRLYTV